METPETILDKIADKIRQGFTSGLEDEGQIRTSWEIDIETWEED